MIRNEIFNKFCLELANQEYGGKILELCEVLK